ncbi:MAG: zinc transporter ZupT [Akkermansia sp.]|nr:zinc transporter ZupT [Akkermansia sp.]
MEEQLLIGGALSLLAGLCTGIGAAVALFLKHTNARMLTFSLGASAGVMVYISFMELMPLAMEKLGEGLANKWIVLGAFFGGMGLAALIDKLVPEDENPHEFLSENEIHEAQCATCVKSRNKVKRSAFLFAIAIGVHNFPEGMATVAAAFDNISIATSVALAVAIHNIPEGLTVAVPLLYGTGSRRKAFWVGTLTGLAEPLGALVCMLVLLPFLNAALLGVLFAIVAGIMVFISFDELLPMAERWGHHHLSIGGVMAGMFIMAAVL